MIPAMKLLNKQLRLDMMTLPFATLCDDLFIEFDDGSLLKIPKGFKTDGCTVPSLLRSVLNPYDNGSIVAAVVHDYVYSIDNLDAAKAVALYYGDDNVRRACDKLYNDLNTDKLWRKWLSYRAIRWFGGRKFGT